MFLEATWRSDADKWPQSQTILQVRSHPRASTQLPLLEKGLTTGVRTKLVWELAAVWSDTSSSTKRFLQRMLLKHAKLLLAVDFESIDASLIQAFANGHLLILPRLTGSSWPFQGRGGTRCCCRSFLRTRCTWIHTWGRRLQRLGLWLSLSFRYSLRIPSLWQTLVSAIIRQLIHRLQNHGSTKS